MKSTVPGRRRFLLLGVVVLLQACNQASNTPKESGSGKAQDDQLWSLEIIKATLTDVDIHHEDGISYATNVHGVDYEVHGGLPGFVKIHGETISIKSGSNRLEVKEGLIMANGKDGGIIQPGDVVVLDAEGQLWVNKEKR